MATRPRRVEEAGRSAHGVEALRSDKKTTSISFWVRFLESRLITATLPPFPGLISPDYGDATSISGLCLPNGPTSISYVTQN